MSSLSMHLSSWNVQINKAIVPVWVTYPTKQKLTNGMLILTLA